MQDVHEQHREAIVSAGELAVDRLCELNVIEQVRHVAATTIVQDAWRRGQPLTLHGWVYGLRDGLLRDLGFTAAGPGDVLDVYRGAVAAAGPLRGTRPTGVTEVL